MDITWTMRENNSGEIELNQVANKWKEIVKDRGHLNRGKFFGAARAFEKFSKAELKIIGKPQNK